MLLYRVEEKIRDTKRFIRRCRNERTLILALKQELDEQGEDISFSMRSLDAQRRYEKELQKYKRRLDRYERLKTVLQECLTEEEKQ